MCGLLKGVLVKSSQRGPCAAHKARMPLRSTRLRDCLLNSLAARVLGPKLADLRLLEAIRRYLPGILPYLAFR